MRTAYGIKKPYGIKLLLATVSVFSIPKSCKFSNSSIYWRDYFSQILMHVSLPNGKLCVPDALVSFSTCSKSFCLFFSMTW